MISRRQAWCKVAVMIADGLETPTALRFHGDREDSDRTNDKGPIMGMSVESAEALNAWAAALSLGVEAPTLSKHGTRWIHTAYGTWCGYHASVAAYVSAVGEVAAVEGMAKVRAVAEADASDACACGNACSCGNPDCAG